VKPQLTPGEILEIYRKKGLPENFCPVPFSTLLFEANGNVCMCRRKGSEFAIGNIQEQDYLEIWNGEKLKNIRAEFLTGRLRTCAVEVERDHCNLDANNADSLPFIELAVEQQRHPLRISPNFNGHCNVQCEMCHIWRYPDGLYDKIGFWRTLENDILPHLREIDTFSGEPFIQKDTYRLIEMAAHANPNIFWSFTTNANWRLNDTIRSYLDMIQVKTFNLSIDSVDPAVYASIRRGGNLDKVLINFDLLQLYEQERIAAGKSALGLTIHSVIQRSNWKGIPALLTLRKQRNARIHLKCLFEPPELSLIGMTAAEKRQILAYLLESLGREELMMTAALWKVLLKDIPKSDRLELILEFQKKTGIFR